MMTTPIAANGSQGGIRMWPSEEWASRIYDAANIALLVGLVMGAVATLLIIWMGNVKESYLRKQVGDNLAVAALAQKDATEANLKIAELTSENLKLQTVLLPRRIVMGDKNGDKEVRQAKFRELAKYAG